jgi:hypothetical protein
MLWRRNHPITKKIKKYDFEVSEKIEDIQSSIY